MTDRFYTGWIIGGIVVLLIVVGACYLWYQNDIAPYKQEAADAEELLRQSEKSKKVSKTGNNAEQVTGVTPAESRTPTAEKSRNETISVTDKTEPTQAQSNVPAQNAETETEVRVSPYGFGPYPEVPEGFTENVITPIWMHVARFGMPKSADAVDIRNLELIGRVLIKVWQDAPESRRYMEGGFYRNGKVYVNYSNRAYVRYKTIELPDGTTNRVMTSWTAGSLKSPVPDPVNPFQSNDDQIPSGIELIDLDAEDPGINPYSFLGL